MQRATARLILLAWLAAIPAHSTALQNPAQSGSNHPISLDPSPLPAVPAPTGSQLPVDACIDQLASGAQEWFGGQLPAGAIQTALVVGLLSIAPAILLMATSYVRIVVVLGLLRQAIGAQQLPPTQVLAALSAFVTILVMAPVWEEIRREAIEPCVASEQPVDWNTTCQRGIAPLKRFMVAQIQATGNLDSINVFQRHAAGQGGSVSPPLVTAETVSDVPFNVILPAFLVSELKVAFLIGFQIFLPFLVLDLIVSTLSVSMGMVMLPPSMVSLPLKLILFVVADGWNLVLGMLLQSFQTLPGA